MFRWVSVVLAVVLIPLADSRGEDWPTHRHDRLRTAVTSEKLKLPLTKVWTFRSRQSSAAPRPTKSPHMAGYPECSQYTLPMIAAGDAVFFNNPQDGRVVCLDAATGKMRWEFVAPAAVNRTPMFWEGKIYAACDDGHVYCLDASSGKLVWKFQAAPTNRQFLAYGKMVSVWPVRTDVLVDKGIAYFAAGVFPHEGTFLYGIDARTGKLLWRNGTQAENSGQLSLAPGGHLYMTGRDIWVPKDFRGYSKPYYGSPTPFLRADGRFVNGFGSSIEDDPERPKIAGAFLSLLGVVKDGVRYIGASAWKVEGEEKKREMLWQHPTPDRWVDADSGIGVRMEGSPVIFRYDPDLSSLVFAGDTLFHSAFDLDPKKGVGSGIYARDPKDGKVLWSVEIPERANQLVVANGRLFVGTRSGTIYSFAPAGTAASGDQAEKIEPVLAASDVEKELAAATETIIAESGVSEGYALVLDCQSGQLAAELAQQTKLSVIAVFSDPAVAAKARDAYCQANLHLTRIVTWTAAKDAVLPYSSFFADLIVSESAVLGGELPANMQEIARLQKPIRGVALIGGKQTAEALKKWTTATKQKDWQAIESAGSWAKRTRPRLADAGAWTHMYGDAGNTGCSHDGVLKPPLGVAWFGPPQIEQPGRHTALIVDGILIVPQPNALEACDQYTGRRLWRLDAGSVGVSIAASGKHVYAKIAHVLAQLDLLTGKEKASYLTAFGKEHPWGWFAVGEDGRRVYGAAGGGLFCTEMESGKGNIVWAIGGPKVKDTEKINGTIAMEGGRIYILGGAANEAQRADAIAQMRAWMKTQSKALSEEFEKQVKDRDIRELIAVDADTGKILFRRGVDISNCGGKWLRPAGFGGRRHYNPYVSLGMYAHNGVVVIASQGRADKGWPMWNVGAYKVRASTAIDGKTGKLLWYKFTNHRTRPVIIDDTLHVEPWAYDLRTGEKKTRLHPITGEAADWAWCRPDKQCGIFSASKYFLFGRNKGFGYKDLLNDEGLYTFWHSRSNCFVDHVSGGGLMIKPPQAIYCKCQWSLPFTVAMGQVSNHPAAAPMFAQPGRTLPVKHLQLDFGANGDRRDEAGRLWLNTNRPINHKLLLGYDVQFIMHEGGSEVRRSSRFTPVENADPPFVFASTLVGLKRCVLPVVRPEDGTGTFRVRLGFSALPGDQPGQRVFDVRLNGRTVLENFDVAAQAGGQNRAVWKEFTIEVQSDLVLDMIPKSATTDPARLPILNALEIMREKISTLGMTQPEDVWLNETTSEKPLELHLANLRGEVFRGKLQWELPTGIEIVGLPGGGGAITLEPGSRRKLELQIKAGAKTPRGKHAIVAKLVAQDGRVEIERRWHVEWLGPLERRVLRGGSAPIRQEPLHQLWSRRVRPNRHWEILQVSQGYQKPQDGGAATAYLWFHIPKELRDVKIQQARIRLHAHTSASRLYEAARGSPSASPKSGGPQATLRRLAGPPWPKFNEVKYPNLPKTVGEGARLAPVAGHIEKVDALLPGAIKATDEQPNIYLAVEPTRPGGAVFWSHAAPDSSRAPVLVIDYQK